MIAPTASRRTVDAGPRRRIDTVPGLAAVVDAVPACDVARCLLLVAVAVVDVGGVGAEPVVVQLLSQWRTAGQVEVSTRMELTELCRQAESIALDPRVEATMRDAAFRRARALTCLHFASAATAVGLPVAALREALRESSYEASSAMRGPAGVIGILRDYAAG
ncbi:hypothetical protein HH308_07555 [Gordonia sp. TBRC 11910]|uniref:Uncharacterized protein n=1 Tax=Gordonia asplenii TaxID=2725283 RepID=A0A848KRN2_9ACTN|nr:hypothetical protein [Gordonia asplenii]NMO01070.1 hypothetical protein [Gordonia asplenii]